MLEDMTDQKLSLLYQTVTQGVDEKEKFMTVIKSATPSREHVDLKKVEQPHY